MSLPRMRTAPQLATEYKIADPHTNVNAHFIRGLLLSGKIPFVRAGKKHLINADLFAEYLKTGQVAGAQAPDMSGKIRAIQAYR
jgi:excisionase family DNA binding protein